MNLLKTFFVQGLSILFVGAIQAEQLVSNPTGVRSVSSGHDHTALVNSNGTLYMFGDNFSGQQGDAKYYGTHTPITIPRRMGRGFAAVATGGIYTLLLKEDGTLLGTGDSSAGELGTTTAETLSTPVVIDTQVTAIAADYNTTCYIKADKSLWGTGWNSEGQLGIGEDNVKNLFGVVKLADDVLKVSVSRYVVYIQKTDGYWYGAGYNGYGNIGTGNDENQHTWYKLNKGYSMMNACFTSSAWLTEDGKLYTLGENSHYGSLGNGTIDPLDPNTIIPGPDSLTPVFIANNVKQIVGNYENVLYLTKDGLPWIIGTSRRNSLNMPVERSERPARILPLSDVTTIFHGWDQSFFLKSDGSLWGAGGNEKGQMGNGTITEVNGLIQIGLTVAPVIYKDPVDVWAFVNKVAEFNVFGDAIEALRYDWQRKAAGSNSWVSINDGATYSGTKTATLHVKAMQEAYDGDSFRCIVTTSAGSVTSAGAVLHLAWNRILNMSVRTTAGSGDDKLTVGMSLGGTGEKQILVRSIGPGLAQWLNGTMVDPGLKVFNKDKVQIQQNDNWGGTEVLTTAMTNLQAFPLAANSKDAAIFSPFGATPGSNTYTMATEPSTGAGGILLLELYDADKGKLPKASLINISALNKVGLGAEHLVAGFVIDGNAPVTVLIRAVGQTLGVWGIQDVLQDPKLQVWKKVSDTKNDLVKENDNWGGTSELKAAFASTYAFGLADNAKDAAVLVSLNPGIYTAEVSGVGDTVGKAIIEVYVVP